MIPTIDLGVMMRLLNADHYDPHSVLGMHKVEHVANNPDTSSPAGSKQRFMMTVRSFIPQANSVTVISEIESDEHKRYPMKRIHTDGIFETVMEDRHDFFPYSLEITFHNGDTQVTRDPYSFLPVISEMDRYLFGQGTHYEIFEKLGAHPMQIDGVDGVLFAVWAPNAARVSVIGSFNNWDGRRHMMHVLDRSGIWEIFVPGVSQLDKYKFEIRARDGRVFEKADPYANFFELRPSTSALVYDLSCYQWDDADWMKRRDQEHPHDGPMNIYEVHMGSWKRKTDDGDRFMSYLELADELIPYVKEMGFTHIEMLPVEEHPFDGSWGYQVTGYYAPTSRYGNPDEFRTFVDRCHQNGIGVILDWVPAHFATDAFSLGRYDGTPLYEHEDPRRGEHLDWGTYIFNYGRSEVKNFLIANAIFWIEKFHLDGLRVDGVASLLYLDYARKNGDWVPNKYGGRENLDAVEFLKHMNSVILGKHPHVMLIAEESTSWKDVSRPAEVGGLGFNFKWNMGWMNDFLEYMKKDCLFRKYHQNKMTFSLVYAYSEHYVLVLSHDEVVHGKGSMIGKMPGDLWQKFANLRTAYGFMYGHPGKKLLFMGNEFGQFSEWSEARSLDWFLLEYPHHKTMQDYVRDLNHLYKNEHALWYKDFSPGGFEWINCNDNERSLFTFVRFGENDEEMLHFVCNFTPNPIMDYRMGVAKNGTYVEIMNSDDIKYGGSGILNTEPLTAEPIEWDNRPYSIGLKVPPLGMAVLKFKADRGK